MVLQLSFLHPSFRTSFRPVHRHNHSLRCTATPPSGPGDQYTQYDDRDHTSLAEEAHRVRSISVVQRHYHVLLQKASESIFNSAAKRFLADNPHIEILRSTTDPTFGRLRGEPYPPRGVIIEDEPNGAGAWIKALDRAGKALGPMESNYVDWAVLAEFGEGKGELVAFEILNADWRDGRKVGSMRDALIQHGETIVGDGCKRFLALQSPTEPTCFKTFEVWENMDALREHMEVVDKEFAKDMMKHRAAVNRVRQLFRPLRVD